MGIDQHDLFPAPRFDPLSALLGHDGEPVMVIVGCGRSKRDQPIAARHLYTSDRFQTACATAEILGAPYYILSGLHGLVRPDEVLLPYDLNLTVSDLKHRKAWSERIAAILSELQSTERICLLATAGYAEAFLEISASRGCRPLIVAPLASIDESLHGEWHKQALTPGNAFGELAKFFTNLAAGVFSMPRRYYFCSPQNAGPDLHDLFAKPDEFKTAFVRAWSAGTTGMKDWVNALTPEVSKIVQEFDFSRIQQCLVRDLIKWHATDQAVHFALFGIEPERGDDPAMPAVPTDEELVYVDELLRVYGEDLV